MKLLFPLAIFCTLFAVASCKKEAEVPPTIRLNTNGGYTFGDIGIGTAASLKAGVIVDKAEDELKILTVSVSYDGSATTDTKQKIDITGDPDQFSQDIPFTTRSQTGTEKWIFTVTDSDGNTAQTFFTLTVL